MTKAQAIREIVACHPGALFIFANGLTSRIAAAILGTGPQFYMLGSMGEALAIGIGLASQVSCDVVVVDGDGNSAMKSAGLIGTFPNLHHLVLDDVQYETTGGQENPFPHPYAPTMFVDGSDEEYPRPPAPLEIKTAFKESIVWFRK